MGNEENIYEFFADFGRMGEIDGYFIATPEEVAAMIAEEPTLYFGEVLGKHSEVVLDLTADHISLKSDNAEAVAVVKDLFGESVAGFNPLDYYEGPQ